MTIPSEEVERVAAGLTGAQRGLMLEPMPAACIEGYQPAVVLHRLGLISWREGSYGAFAIQPTELGQQVRTYLERTAK